MTPEQRLREILRRIENNIQQVTAVRDELSKYPSSPRRVRKMRGEVDEMLSELWPMRRATIEALARVQLEAFDAGRK